jgi:hypothetical protein
MRLDAAVATKFTVALDQMVCAPAVSGPNSTIVGPAVTLKRLSAAAVPGRGE